MTFSNTFGNEPLTKEDSLTEEIIREGNVTLKVTQELNEGERYDGNENSLLLYGQYQHKFICKYDLAQFPFDTQICYLDIKSSPDLRDLIQFVTDQFVYEGPLDLTEYSIKKINMTAEKKILLRIEIIIQRRLLSLILTAFLPTLILNIIGHMSNYFKEFFFEGLMSLNVTVMLVLTTMFLR